MPLAKAELVAVLGGGHASEHEVSLRSASCLAQALQAGGTPVLPVAVALDGTWHLLPEAAPLGAVFRFPEQVSQPPEAASVSGPPARVAAALLERGVRVVVLGLHGRGGEDGVIQGFLELCGLAYTGCRVGTSALAADKGSFKRILQGEGLPTPAWRDVSRSDLSDEPEENAALVADLLDELELPLVVKPQSLGSSRGVRLVAEGRELAQALLEALELDPGVLVEEQVLGREFTCAVLGRARVPETFPVVEIVPRKAAWFDHASKYEPGGADEIVPASIGPEQEWMLRDLAADVHRLLRADGTTRTDFMLDAEGRAWILETNTLPGMTAGSLYPKAVMACGWSMTDLVLRMVADALAR